MKISLKLISLMFLALVGLAAAEGSGHEDFRAGGYPQQGGGYQKPGVGYQQHGGGYQKPGGGYQQHGGGYQKPGGGHHQGGSGGYRLQGGGENDYPEN